MKIMKKIFLIFVSFASITVACSDWLDVQPKTSIKGEDLFSSESGFKDALTGFYLNMAKSEVYAKEMTYGYVDLLAGNYDNYPGEYYEEKRYDYDVTWESTKNGIYTKLYNIIANINNFLHYLDKNRNVLTTEHYYEIMKGEALGLRAFLHFDLLRLFGPVYKLDPKAKAIPYRKSFDREATPLLSVEDVTESVISDLMEADTLLEKYDSKDFTRSTFNVNSDPFLRMRMLRMNTYAVKALLARVYCYRGDEDSKRKAVKYAQEVIAAETYFMLDEGNSSQIRVNEHIFGLNINEFDKILETNYRMTLLQNTQNSEVDFIMRRKENLDIQFEKSGIGLTDWRAGDNAFLTTGNAFAREYVICQKYNQSSYANVYGGKDIVPLIRLPEMYYVIAECGTPEESVAALNAVRESRGIAYANALQVTEGYDKPKLDFIYDNTQSTRVYEVMKEYQKEYFSEGQLWFFYKRYNFKTFFTCPLEDVRDKYQWSLPDNEKLFGNNN